MKETKNKMEMDLYEKKNEIEEKIKKNDEKRQ
jgi:hypothetical protein